MRNFMERTFAVALTDCWVSDSYRIRKWLSEVSIHYYHFVLLLRNVSTEILL